MAKGKRTTTKRVQATEKLPPPALVPDVPVKPEMDEDGYDPGTCLTTRQRRFVKALVGPAAGNATKAARMAGYRDDNEGALRVTAHRTLTNANVQEAIAHEFAKLNDSPEWARASLIELASSSMRNFLMVDEKGNTTLDFNKAAAAGALGQIREYREEVLKVRDSDVQTIKRTVKVHDRTPAVVALLKLHGKLVERHEHRIDLSDLSDDELLTMRRIIERQNGYATSDRGQGVPGSN